jgi:hypothetical protein
MTDKTDVIAEAFSKAIVDVIQAVAGSAGSVVGANQQTAGAEGATGGVSAQQGSSQQHTGASHKNDVSAPELIESYNLSMQNDIAQMSKSNAKLYDVSATAIGLATLGAGSNMFQQQVNLTGHADEEFSARKRATVISLVTVGDAVEEGADDTDE